MPWYNGKFFFEKEKINIVSDQRFTIKPPKNLFSNDLLVFNSTTHEVNSRPVSSIGAVGPRGLDGNSSLWEFKDSGIGQPGAGEFRFDGGNTFGDGELYINVIDNLGNDMTNWLQNFAYGDILVLRSYDSYNEFAIYQIKDSGFTSTITNNVITIPLIVAAVTNPVNELIDAFGSGVSGQGGSFAVNSICTIGYVKGGIKGPRGDTLNSSNWLWGSSNFSAFNSGQFTSFASGSSTNSLSNTTSIEINPVDRNGNTIGTGPSTSVGSYIATGWFGLFNTGDVLTVQYSENNYATYRLTKQPEWVVSSFPGNPAIIRLSVEFVNNGSASSTFTILEYGIGLVNGGMNAGLDYNFDEVIIPPSGSPISFGSIRLNNTTQNTSTEAYLSVEVANGNSVGTFINSWNSFGNNPGTRGFLQFKTNHNHDFLTFDVTNVSFTTTGGPHYIIQLTNGVGAIGTPYINNELVSVNFIPAGTDGGSGSSGPINSTVSFFSDFCKIPGGGMYNIPTFTLDLVNNLKGVPILPHGSGAFASAGGVAMQVPTGALSNANIWTYGAYMPQAGVIYCAAINYYYKSVSSGGSGPIRAINYSTGITGTIYSLTGVNDRGSADQTFLIPISFSQGDYIGIAIKNSGGIADQIVVEGTLFLKLT